MRRKITKVNSLKLPITLAFILLVAVFFRFYRVYDWLFFGMDQEYQALIVNNIVRGLHFPLIGVNASDTGLYLGPLFSYFSSIPFALSGGNPMGWAVVASSVGVVTCAIVFIVGSKMFSRRIGLLAALFYAVSFLISFYDRQYWNPTFVPLISLLLGYQIFQLLKKYETSLIWIAFLLGLATHIHLSLLLFIPLVIFAWWKVRRSVHKKTVAYAAISALLMLSPLIVFDIHHGFTNVKAAVRTFSGLNASTHPSTFISRGQAFLSTLGRFVWVPAASDLFVESGQCTNLSSYRKDAYPEGILITVLGIGIFYHIIKDRKKERLRFTVQDVHNLPAAAIVLLGIIILTVLFVIFYQRLSFEYYFLYLFPWLSIMLAVSARYLWQKEHAKVVVITIIIIMMIANFLTLTTSYSSYSYKDKIEAMKFAGRFVHENAYNVDAVGDCARFGGYRFLFDRFVGTPIWSYMDVYFRWLYENDNLQAKADRIVLLSMVDHRDVKEIISQWQQIKYEYLTNYPLIQKEKFGNIEVLILSAHPNSARAL